MINSRALLVTIFVLLAFVGLVVQLFSVQVGNYEKYSDRANRQQNKVYSLRAERGIIYDRNKEILAYTKDDVSLFVDSRMIRNKKRSIEKLSTALAEIFETKPSKYINLIKNGKRDVCLEKKVAREKALLLEDLVVDGFYKKEDYTRIYPYKNITSHLLGYVDKNCNGLSGIEKLYNDQLCGIDGELHVERDAIGKTVTIDFDNSVAAEPGKSYELTIDKVYQKILVTELTKGVKEYEGQSGIGIIVNPKTGEILALANVPDFDPNEYNKFSNFERRNRALTDTYEPGSTMKSIVLAMLFEEDLVKENQVLNTENGKYRIKGAWIRDTHKFEKLTVREILEQSSNVGMVKLSDRIDNRDFYKGLRDFGFGNPTSIDLIGETKGLLKKPDSFSGISKAFISHGYEISVTPIQMVMAYAALVNGGKLLQPRILNKVYDGYGDLEDEFETVKVRNVISEETSELIKNIMLGVVENGTGSNAQQDNIYVGGKTGTAQKLIDGRYTRNYNSSFIGFFPAEDPEVLCFILVDSPQKGKYGGQVAAPIFSNITKRILETDFKIERNKEKIERNELINSFMTNVVKNVEHEDVMTFANVGEEKIEIKKDKIVRTTMPKLINKSLREAIALLSDLGIDYEVNGYGKVVGQSIKQGSSLKEGLTCVLECSAE